MIVSFSPFFATEKGYDGLLNGYSFKCPHCGSSDIVKLGEFDKFNFFSGHYMCAHCGKSQFKGKVFNYYNDCFYCIPVNKPVQLTLF